MHIDPNVGPCSPFTLQGLGPTVDSESISGQRLEPAQQLPAQTASIVAENHELRAEVECLRAERSRLADVQARVMDLIGCKSADRLVHDLRNVLNERDLYRALADALPD